MWHILFGKSIFCFFSAGACSLVEHPDATAAALILAAVGVLAAGGAIHRRLTELGRTALPERGAGTALS